MLRLTCPYCGQRSREEFSFGGESPNIPDAVTDPGQRNVDYVWFFDNVEGPSTERWFHHGGCRRWHTAHRDTATDTVLSGHVADPLAEPGV
jgi:heterotetrameric sarcosine oxidase delta subunit